MNVLFLPFNIASMQATMCEALNKIECVNARCLNIQHNKYSSGNNSVVYLSKEEFRPSEPLSVIRYLRYRATVKRWIRWADVVHYVWGAAFDDGADLAYASKLKKPIFVEWVGSDIRDPVILSPINPFYQRTLTEGYEYRDIEMSDYKRLVQKRFAKAHAVPTLLPEMSLYLDGKLFNDFIFYPHRLDIESYQATYPSIASSKPLIVHSPSAKVVKGTDKILSIIEQLKSQYDFDFALLHDLPRQDALQVMQKADIFIDQIIVGGYGMAACEAMAFGKPVISYLLPEVYSAGLPSDCPIINANPNTLKDKLVDLILDPLQRNETGRRGRLFVEAYNNADKIAADFVQIYQSAISKSS